MPDNDQRPIVKKDTWIILLILVAVIVLFVSTYESNQEVVYDCRDAHWHPDVPVDVKRECQRLIYEELKRIREEEIKKRFITA